MSSLNVYALVYAEMMVTEFIIISIITTFQP
jgi:hypothetical protein